MSAPAQTVSGKVSEPVSQQTPTHSPTHSLTDSPALFFAERARAIVEFCVRHRGAAFPDWSVPTLYQYVFFHVVTRTVFVVWERGAVRAVLFAWGEREADIRARAAAGEPAFHWQRSADFADALLVAEVIGRQKDLPRLERAARQRWPDWPRKKIYTYRAGELRELKRGVLERMLQHGR